eukprot:3266399-Prymnesium_polylepis.1
MRMCVRGRGGGGGGWRRSPRFCPHARPADVGRVRHAQNAHDNMLGACKREGVIREAIHWCCLLYTSPSPRDAHES